MAEEGDLVQLYVYDISGGIARALSPSLLGTTIEGVWHSSIVLRGCEHYFGGGINVATAGTTPFGHPVQVIDLGRTFLDQETIEALLVELSERYTIENYSLFENNCNNFSDALGQLLTGQGIPEHITGLPAAVLATPFGQMLRPMLAGLEAQMKSMRSQAFQPHHGALQEQQQQAQEVPIASSLVPAAAAAASVDEKESPELLAAEKELEAAVAEASLVDMSQRIDELKLKEGEGTPRQQLGEAGAVRLATEVAVKREMDRLMAEGNMPAKDAEALAVERIAAMGGGHSSPRHRSRPGSPAS